MAKKRVKGSLTIRVSLVPGICRWCRCTYDRPCENGCSWVDRAQTLCSECETLDTAMQTAKGRQALAEELANALALSLTHPPKARRRR